MNSTQYAVFTENLTRIYKRQKKALPTTALDSVDLAVPRGEVHGLLGPNGAGKTTLCKILSTVLLPTNGRAWVSGKDVVTHTAEVRRNVGIVFGGERGLYNRLSAESNLEFWATLYGLRGKAMRARVGELLERFGLDQRARDRVEGFSRGMKQRLHLARGLVGDPQVILLDEPTTGMDPVAARDFRDLVADLKKEGRSVLITTHDMAEAEAICDRVSLIDAGRIIVTETPATLSQWLNRYVTIHASNVPSESVTHLVAEISKLPGVESVKFVDRSKLKIETTSNGAAPVVMQLLFDSGIMHVAAVQPSLADVYLHVIGDRGMRVSE